MRKPSVTLTQLDYFRTGPAWQAQITLCDDETITRYYPFTGGEWIDYERQGMGTADFNAGSERRKAWRRIRNLHTEVTA